MAHTESKDEFLADLARAPSILIECTLPVRLDGERLLLDGARTTADIVGPASLRGVAVQGQVSHSWCAVAKFEDATRISFSEWFVEADRETDVLLTRNSERIQRPESTLRIELDGAMVEFDCLDVSAGGLGAHSTERFPLQSGKRVVAHLNLGDADYVLQAFVAHTDDSRRGTLVGLQFAPLRENVAKQFYNTLNELAGEPVVDVLPTAAAVPEFFDAVRHGECRASLVLSGTLQDDVFVLDGATSLAGNVSELAVYRNDGVSWRARVDCTEAGELLVRQVGRIETAEQRGGYRVSAPRGCTATLTIGDAAPLSARVNDLSRGGVGLMLSQKVELLPRQFIDFELHVPGLFREVLRGQVAHLSAKDAESRVGIAFSGTSPARMAAVHELISKLEDRELITRVAVAGAAVFLLLALLVAVGSLVEFPDPATKAPAPDVSATP